MPTLPVFICTAHFSQWKFSLIAKLRRRTSNQKVVIFQSVLFCTAIEWNIWVFAEVSPQINKFSQKWVYWYAVKCTAIWMHYRHPLGKVGNKSLDYRSAWECEMFRKGLNWSAVAFKLMSYFQNNHFLPSFFSISKQNDKRGLKTIWYPSWYLWFEILQFGHTCWLPCRLKLFSK